MKRLLLLTLLVAGSVALAGQARATTCEQTHTVTSTAGFNDCAGRAVTVNELSYSGVSLGHSGTWDGDDWFTDFHVTLDPNSGDAVSSIFGSFTNITQGVAWTVDKMIVAGDGMIWFTADSFADRVRPGDEYSWNAYATFAYFTASAVDVTIKYTMDVPEPALGIVLLGGLASLALVRRRAA